MLTDAPQIAPQGQETAFPAPSLEREAFTPDTADWVLGKIAAARVRENAEAAQRPATQWTDWLSDKARRVHCRR